MNSQLKAFVTENSWRNKMENSRGLDNFSNYSGPNLGDLIVVVSRSRDSDIMQESNFDTALERLGGVSKNVQIERFGHWGCGWFELILVNPKSVKHVKIAYQIAEDLKKYPILDEEYYYEREGEYHSEYAQGAKKSLAKAMGIHFGITYSSSLLKLCYDLNMVCQHHYGNDSCINIYECRVPDARDKARLKECMEQISSEWKKSKVYRALIAKL